MRITTVGKAYREDAATGFAKAVEPGLTLAVREIPGDDASGVKEGQLRVCEGDAVLSPVLGVLYRVPLEAWAHGRKYSRRMGSAPYADMGSGDL